MPDYLTIVIACSIGLLSLIIAGTIHTVGNAIAEHRSAQAQSILHHAGLLDED